MSSVAPSDLGDTFRRIGAVGKGRQTFASVGREISMMSARIIVIGEAYAQEAEQILEDSLREALDEGLAGSKWSVGRLKATIGTYREDLLDPDSDPKLIARQRSTMDRNKVESELRDLHGYGNDKQRRNLSGSKNKQGKARELQAKEENDAYKSIRKYKGAQWSVEVGTFTPYAHLVNDGGSMEILPYGNSGVKQTVIAHWTATHFVENGLRKAEGRMTALSIQVAKGLIA